MRAVHDHWDGKYDPSIKKKEKKAIHIHINPSQFINVSSRIILTARIIRARYFIRRGRLNPWVSFFFSLNGWKCCSQGKSIRAQNREREREREGGRGMRRRRLLSREQQQADRWISRDFVVVIDTRARSRAVVLLSASGAWIYTGFERVYAVYLHEPRRKTPALSLLGKKTLLNCYDEGGLKVSQSLVKSSLCDLSGVYDQVLFEYFYYYYRFQDLK